MNPRRSFAPLSVLLAVGVAAVADARASAQVLGVTWEGQVVVRNDDSSEASVLGPSGFFDINALARSPSGVYVAYTNSSIPRLLKIDPKVGSATVHALPFLNDVRALAYHPDGRLFAADHATSALYTLDPSVPFGSSSIKQLVGSLTPFGMAGLAFSSNGALYGWSVAQGLVSIDPTTAVCTDLNASADGGSFIQALAFRSDDRLYGFREDVYRFDLSNGAFTSLGIANAFDLRGAEFAPEWLPELEVTSLVTPGTPIAVDIDAPAQSVVLLGVSPNAGFLCLPPLPACLQLGSDPAAIVLAATKLVGASEELHLEFPTLPDPGILGVRLHWQVVSVAPGGALGVSDHEVTLFH